MHSYSVLGKRVSGTAHSSHSLDEVVALTRFEELDGEPSLLSGINVESFVILCEIRDEPSTVHIFVLLGFLELLVVARRQNTIHPTIKDERREITYLN